MRVDVREFGAVGNGTHDDTTAIEKAFAVLKPGDILYIPAKHYVLGRKETE